MDLGAHQLLSGCLEETRRERESTYSLNAIGFSFGK